jgi:hypothetical protein
MMMAVMVVIRAVIVLVMVNTAHAARVTIVNASPTNQLAAGPAPDKTSTDEGAGQGDQPP